MARSRGTWTPEQARLFARKGGINRWKRAEARAAELAKAALDTAAAAAQTPQHGAPPLPSVDFASLLLAHTRAHLRNLNQVLSLELCKRRPDAQRMNWLAQALERLAEIERRLAGRPLPVSRRPAPASARRPQADPPPEAEPEPIAEPAPPAGLLTDRPEW